MLNQPSEYEDLLSIRWIRELNKREQARLERLLAAAPEEKVRWAEDMAVLKALGRLPDVPVAANFTSRVMAALVRKTGEHPPAPALLPKVSWFEQLGWAPRLSLGFAVVLVIAGFYVQHKRGESARLAESLAVIAESGTAPTLEELQHFEAIQMLAQVPPDVDWELIAAMDSLP